MTPWSEIVWSVFSGKSLYTTWWGLSCIFANKLSSMSPTNWENEGSWTEYKPKRSLPHAVIMLLDAVCQQHWWIPTRLEKHTVTLKEWRPCKRASTNRHTCRYCAVIWQHTKTACICWSNWQVVCDSNAENLNGSDAANVRYRWRQIVSGLTYTHTVCEYCFSWLWPV